MQEVLLWIVLGVIVIGVAALAAITCVARRFPNQTRKITSALDRRFGNGEVARIMTLVKQPDGSYDSKDRKWKIHRNR